ncbi:hypothetical protein EBS02_01580 [bacterium]|nr:hypothetical protein [bacterium]
MAKNKPFQRQLENRNFLAPNGFKFILANYPQVDFFSNECNIPEITLGTAIQPTYLKDIDIPGDKLVYEDFTLKFIVDEDMKNYTQIHNWMRGLGYPESIQEIINLKKDNEYVTESYVNTDIQYYSDGTLQILNSSFLPKFLVKFYQLFPISLSTLRFDATINDIDYLTAEVTFKYTLYDIMDTFGNRV